MTCLPITFLRKSFGDPLIGAAAAIPFLAGAPFASSPFKGAEVGDADAMASASDMLAAMLKRKSLSLLLTNLKTVGKKRKRKSSL